MYPRIICPGVLSALFSMTEPLFGCCHPSTDPTPPLSPWEDAGETAYTYSNFWAAAIQNTWLLERQTHPAVPLTHRAPELLQSMESHASSAHQSHNQQVKPVCWLVLLNKCSCSFDTAWDGKKHIQSKRRCPLYIEPWQAPRLAPHSEPRRIPSSLTFSGKGY